MGKDDQEKKLKWKHRWKFEFQPLLLISLLLIWIFFILLIGYLLDFEFMPLLYDTCLIFFVIIIVFWLSIYLVIELILWIKTKNPGHQFQFFGVLLILVVLLFFMISYLILYRYGFFYDTPEINNLRLFSRSIWLISFTFGIFISLFGYYRKKYRSGDVSIYRNLIVEKGEKITELTNGYSFRISSRMYEEISQISKNEFKSNAKQFGKFLAVEGILFDWDIERGYAKYYLMTYTGIGRFKLFTIFSQLWALLKEKDKLSWISIDVEGNVNAYISKYDYDRIEKPVAYHLLNDNFMDSFITSFILFYKGKKNSSLNNLIEISDQETKKIPQSIKRKQVNIKRSKIVPNVISIISIIFIILNVAIIPLAWIATERPDVVIVNVNWSPKNPYFGDTINITTSIDGVRDPHIIINEGPYVELFYYFTYYGFFDFGMSPISEGKYFTNIPAPPNGTEISFRIGLSYEDGLFSTDQSFIRAEQRVYSDEYVIQIGHVERSDVSELRISEISYEKPHDIHGNIKYNAQIEHSENISIVKIITNTIGRSAENIKIHGGGGRGWTFWEMQNMTENEPNNFYIEIPLVNDTVADLYFIWNNLKANIYFKIVVKDNVGNTAASKILSFEYRYNV